MKTANVLASSYTNMAKGKGHDPVEKLLSEPYGTLKPNTNMGEFAHSGMNPLVEPGDPSRDTVLKDKCTRVTIVVTLSGMGSEKPRK